MVTKQQPCRQSARATTMTTVRAVERRRPEAGGVARAAVAPDVSSKPSSATSTAERRWERLALAEDARAALLDQQAQQQVEQYQRNIERFIGTVKVPVGVAGPLRMRGSFAEGDYLLPLATTEAALVASYHRGAQVISAAGGCAALLLDEGVGRAPGFAFRTLDECRMFVSWARSQIEAFRRVAGGTTRYGRLKGMRPSVEGNHVYLHFTYTTGDAAGQNMATFATEAICAYISEHAPIRPRYFFLEANFSGDKKASAQSFLSVRGKKVTAEAIIPAALVRARLHTTPERMADYFTMGALGGVLSGTIGVQGQFANGLAALFLACGQDVDCVAEAAVGVTRFEVTPEGDLYGAVTLPNLIVGTVGGGTQLPSQRACLEIMGLVGPGHAQAFAEVCAGMCLAGELSLTAALCSNQFARAHQRLARGVRSGSSARGAAHE